MHSPESLEDTPFAKQDFAPILFENLLEKSQIYPSILKNIKINSDLHGKFMHPISSPHWMGVGIHKAWYDGFSTNIKNALKRRFCISVFDLCIGTQILNVPMPVRQKKKGWRKYIGFYIGFNHSISCDITYSRYLKFKSQIQHNTKNLLKINLKMGLWCCKGKYSVSVTEEFSVRLINMYILKKNCFLI